MEHTEKNNQLVLATEFLDLAQPKGQLVFYTVLTVLGLLVTGGADLFAVGHAMREKSTGPLGDFTGSTVELVGVSLFTLFVYWGIAICLKQPPKGRYLAGALYLFVVVILAFALWQTQLSDSKALWDSLNTSSVSVFGPADGKDATPHDAPRWFLIAVDALWAVGYTAAGLLFIWCKYRFEFYMEQWRIRAAAREKLKQAETSNAANTKAEELANWIEHVETNFHAILRHVFRLAIEQETAAVASRRDELRRKAQSITTSRAGKGIASAEIEKLDAWLVAAASDDGDKSKPPIERGKKTTSVMAVVFLAGVGLVPTAARAESSAELCAVAPSLQVLIDVSGSSPVQFPEYNRAVIGVLESKVRALPLCSRVLVVSVGDARTMPETMNTLVLNRTVAGQGGTRDDIVRGLRQVLAGLQRRKLGENGQSKSELIGAFADAARNFNPKAKAPNIVVLLSDGIENSGIAICGVRPCHFPPPTFRLTGADVAILGCGLNLSSDLALSLTRTWEIWFAQAGVKADLRRSF